MYKVFADGELIYDSTLEDYKLGKGEITREVDKSGSFVFSLYPDHFYYDRFVKMKTVIVVYRDDRIIFRGRVLDDAADYWNNKTLTCEGELGFLRDSIIRPFAFSGTPEKLFRQFIEAHNNQVGEFKRFKIGRCTVVDPNGYIARANSNYENTLSNLNSRLLEDATGGHFYITHGDDGTDPVPTIHYLAEFTKEASQPIEFGVNLRNFVKKENAQEVATAIIPLGATVDDGDSDTEDPKLTIASVNGGVDFLYSAKGVALRDWIFKTVEWDDVTEPSRLKSKAQAYLEAIVNQSISIELTAVDMHLLDRSIESYNVCEYVRATSQPHNFADTLLCTKQTINILNPANDSLVLGHTFASFSEQQARTASSVSNIQSMSGKINRAAQVAKKNTQDIAGCNAEIVDIITRLDALYAAGYITIYVGVTDSGGAIRDLLQGAGTLTVNGQRITSSGAKIAVATGAVQVVYTLASDLATARTVTANGVAMGTVSTAGQSVSGSVSVADGGTVTIAFTT